MERCLGIIFHPFLSPKPNQKRRFFRYRRPIYPVFSFSHSESTPKPFLLDWVYLLCSLEPGVLLIIWIPGTFSGSCMYVGKVMHRGVYRYFPLCTMPRTKIPRRHKQICSYNVYSLHQRSDSDLPLGLSIYALVCTSPSPTYHHSGLSRDTLPLPL